MNIRKVLNALCLAGAVVLALNAMASAAQSGGSPQTATAIFAGGCFWSVERFFDKVEGVLSTVSGYTGHAESVQVTYDPKKVSYEKLLDAFWHNIDPLTPDGQFCDMGNQYRTAIFYHDEGQKSLAEKSKSALQGRFKQPIVTQILSASQFYPAEEYHQDFHVKNPARYQAYRIGCGRDQRLTEIWGNQKSDRH